MKSFLIIKIVGILVINILLLNAQIKSQTQTDGDGLTGYYYQNFLIDSSGVIDFTDLTLAFTRIDTVIDFWNGAANYNWQPVPGWGNYYSVQWKGYILIDTSGRYGFGTISDDGSQIWINDSLIVDNADYQWFDWEDNISEGDTAGTSYPPMILDSGYHEIEVRFFEHVSLDGIELWWLKPGADSSDIPYYGTNFHDIAPAHNINTNWEIIPKSVLFTEIDTTATKINLSNQPDLLPGSMQLLQNYPNPFNPETVISWQLAVGSHVELSVYNLLGEKMATLVSERMNPGNHSYTFVGRNLASGIYYYQLVAGEFREVKKMVLLR